jgi:hypothetical protein
MQPLYYGLWCRFYMTSAVRKGAVEMNGRKQLGSGLLEGGACGQCGPMGEMGPLAVARPRGVTVGRHWHQMGRWTGKGVR